MRLKLVVRAMASVRVRYDSTASVNGGEPMVKQAEGSAGVRQGDDHHGGARQRTLNGPRRSCWSSAFEYALGVSGLGDIPQPNMSYATTAWVSRSALIT